MATHEQAMSTTMKLLTVGAFFSDTAEHDRLWVSCIERFATRAQQQSGLTVLIEMQQYPTLLALYALALGSLAANRVTGSLTPWPRSQCKKARMPNRLPWLPPC